MMKSSEDFSIHSQDGEVQRKSVVEYKNNIYGTSDIKTEGLYSADSVPNTVYNSEQSIYNFAKNNIGSGYVLSEISMPSMPYRRAFLYKGVWFGLFIEGSLLNWSIPNSPAKSSNYVNQTLAHIGRQISLAKGYHLVH